MYQYSSIYDKEKMARAVGVGLPISFKQSVEVCSAIRGKTLQRAIDIINNVEKYPIRFTRFNRGGTGHKPGVGPARHPYKTCKEIAKVLQNVQSNASLKGLDTKKLAIKHVNAQKAGNSFHYGRQSRRKMKRTHIEVIVFEKEIKKVPAKKESAKKKETADKK